MSWFEKIMPSRIKTERRTRSVPEGLWIKCPACDAVLYRAELERNLYDELDDLQDRLLLFSHNRFNAVSFVTFSSSAE